MNAINSPGTPNNQLVLTQEEMRLIRAYRAIDDDSQGFHLEALERLATQPFAMRRPTLRLVEGRSALVSKGALP